MTALTRAWSLIAGYVIVLAHAIAHWHSLGERSVRRALGRQIVVTGLQGLPYIAVIALLFGAVAVTRVIALLGPDDDTALKNVVWGGLRELGPLLTALIIIVRSGVAIAAEVALMRLRGGIRDTHWRDLDDEDEVVTPRVLGTAISAAALVSCFQFLALAAALMASSTTLGTSLEFELDAFLIVAEWQQVPLSIGKGFLFGAGIATIACWHGLQASQDMVEVPKAVAAACLGAFIYVLVVDLIAAGLTLL